ncbi:MAG: MBL fold metallo-hydrolase [Bacteroidales bacterium]|nr:MBL fold metallo-hydrolase [Bacteroidales bacterium]
MKIYRTVFNSYMVNTYLLLSDNKQAVIIDPAFANQQEWEMMNNKIVELGASLQMALVTHAHADHIMGAALLLNAYPNIAFMMHKDSLPLYQDANNYAMIMGFEKQNFPQPTQFYADNQQLEIDNHRLTILSTPGHAPGSVSVYSQEDNVVFTGDALFRCSIGRTDLQGGSFDVLKHSIQQKLYTLPDETLVLPGHGDSSTIAFEKHYNPFVND